MNGMHWLTASRPAATADDSRPNPSCDAMNGKVLQRTVRITNPMGLHVRPAAAFAQLAMKFQCDVFVTKGNRTVNGKSGIDLLSLGADMGSDLLLQTSGSDAPQAMEALVRLLKSPVLEDGPKE